MSNDEATKLETLANQSRAKEKRRRVDHKKEWYVSELAKCQIRLSHAEAIIASLDRKLTDARKPRGFWARVLNVR